MFHICFLYSDDDVQFSLLLYMNVGVDEDDFSLSDAAGTAALFPSSSASSLSSGADSGVCELMGVRVPQFYLHLNVTSSALRR